MPPGVPVATMGIGKSGATNAGIFAVQILALENEDLMQRLVEYKDQLENSVAEKSRRIEREDGKTGTQGN
jgi:phosphoribosylcarboxyaminoimidazole (NCAIR) mutase